MENLWKRFWLLLRIGQLHNTITISIMKGLIVHIQILSIRLFSFELFKLPAEPALFFSITILNFKFYRNISLLFGVKSEGISDTKFKQLKEKYGKMKQGIK